VKYDLKTVVEVVLVVIITILIDSAWKVSLENSARTQAKYNLAQIKLCVDSLLLTDEDGLYTKYSVKTDKELNKALFVCAKNMKVSPQGDVWAYNLQTKKYVFDSNVKYGTIANRYWDKAHVCKSNKDWCGRLLTIMNSGYDSTWLGYSWVFKNDKEYLEWKVLPDETLGFDGKSRSGISTPQQIVVIQGAREKELLDRYRYFRMVVYGLGFVAIVLVLLNSSYLHWLEEKHNGKK